MNFPDLAIFERDGVARANRQITKALRKGQSLFVMVVRLNDIQKLCASYGHKMADEIMEEFFKRLVDFANDGDAIQRIGQQRFVVLLNGLDNRGYVTLAAQKIERITRELMTKYGKAPVVRAAIGIASGDTPGTDAQDLMRCAEIASLDAHLKGQPHAFYENAGPQHLIESWAMEKRLSSAIETGQMRLHFQPKLCLTSREIVGVEALMRWEDEKLGTISPDVFIQLAEETGQIVELTQFAIHHVCRQLHDWRDSMPGLNAAVNVTPSMIRGNDVIDMIKSAAGIWDVSFDALTVEVTENALLEDRVASHRILKHVQALGAQVSIDDFGTGYSSMAYLKEIPANELKIDRSFVGDMLEDEMDHKIVEHCIGIANSFGLRVVAEGIETKAVLDELSQLGCDFAQGYYICRPLPAAELLNWYEHQFKAAIAV
ncbi:MAG: GGDEF domain-containing phosphodiesterase [Pseudomonadota bacterium]